MPETDCTTRCNLIGVAGGSGSGKTTFARDLELYLGSEQCSVLSQDRYYIDQSAKFTGDGESVNFDHPDALDFELLADHLERLKKGLHVDVPIYDFVTHTRKTETFRFGPCSIVIIDGTLILSQPRIREILDLRVFIETPEAIRFQRRYQRDLHERGRTPEGIEKQFIRQVKPMHDEYVEPSKSFAHYILSGVEPIDPGAQEWVRGLKRVN